MAKSKGRRRSPAGQHKEGAKGAPLSTSRMVLWGLLAAALGGGGWFVWSSLSAESAFLELVEQGQGALKRVETQPDSRGGHLSPGQSGNYGTRFPTSGAHDPQWTNPGFHDAVGRPERLLHALEHGNIVIYYERPPAAVLETLRDWADLYKGQWSGIVVSPMPGLGEGVVLAAWRQLLRLEEFDPAAAAAFIDRYRGRGPENPVR